MRKTCVSSVFHLFVCIIVCLVSIPSASAANFSIDFRDAVGSPTQNSEEFQINNIGVDIPTTNPLTGETITTHVTGNILWKFFYDCICLRPVGASTGATQCNDASLTVNVTDALTGQAIANATVTVGDRTGTSNASGAATISGLTANSQSPTSVQVSVSATGYVSQTVSVTLNCGQTASTGVALLSSSNTGTIRGDLRIILTWGQNPADLDSHLTGPKSGATDRFHVYYSAKNNCSSAPCNAAIPAWLDVDDVSSFGPETVTIQKVNSLLANSFVPGLYRYSVHHYAGTSTIPGSGAQVKLYEGSNLLRTFTPPPAGSQAVADDWVWTVVEIQILADGTVSINEVGTYSGPTSPPQVQVMTPLGITVETEDYGMIKGSRAK